MDTCISSVVICCRAKDVKEKFSFLRRRHTDTSLAGKMSGEKAGGSGSSSGSKPGDTARSWTKSFDTLLMDKRKSAHQYLFQQIQHLSHKIWFVVSFYGRETPSSLPVPVDQCFHRLFSNMSSACWKTTIRAHSGKQCSVPRFPRPILFLMCEDVPVCSRLRSSSTAVTN